MNGIILYQSRYGATKTYAQWLAQATGFPCRETRRARLSDLQGRDVVILGGGVYASGIAGLSFLRKVIGKLPGQKVLVFCVGASPYDQAVFQEIVTRNMTGPLANIPCFYCRGAWNMDSMSAVDRNLCKFLRKTVAKRPPSEYAPWERALMEAGTGPCDWRDPAYLQPILDALGSMGGAAYPDSRPPHPGGPA